MDRLIKYIFVINFCLMALVFSFNHKTVDGTVETRDLIFGFFTLILFILTMNKAWDDPKSVDFAVLKRAIFPIAGVWFLATLYSIIFCYNSGEVIYKSAQLFALIVYIFLAAVNLKDFTVIIKSAVIISLILGGYYIYQYIEYPKIPELRTGTMANMNLNSSAFFLLAGFDLIYLSDLIKNQWIVETGWFRNDDFAEMMTRTVTIIAICICLFAIATLRTRSVYLAIIVAFLVWVPKRIKIFIPLTAMLIIAGVSIYMLKGPAILNTSSLYERKNLWRAVLMQIKERPVTGIGAGNWVIELPLYAKYMDPQIRAKIYNAKVIRRVHNDFFTELAETGWVGFACFVFVFFFTIWNSRTNRILMGLTAGLAVVMFFSYLMERPFHRMIFGFTIAMALNITGKNIIKIRPGKRAIQNVSKKKMAFFIYTVTAVLVFCLYDFYVRYDMSKKFRRIYQATIDGQFKTVLFETVKTNPLMSIGIDGKPLTAIRADAWFFLGDYDKAKNCYEESLSYNPNNFCTLMNIGFFEKRKGNLEKASYYYKKVLDMYPDYENAKTALDKIK